MSVGRNTTQRDRDRARIASTQPACAICGNPINYTLKWPDPMCFVVDHINPIKRGGIDHISNKQATHNTCNSTKRARLVAPVIKRSGALD